MTREEAIKILAKMRERYRICGIFEAEALNMAIQALSQEPCDDAIDREYLFKVLDDFCGHDRTATITLDTLADIVYELPSVTQKSGKWIKVKSGDKDFPESIVCSRCSNENSHLDFNENAEPIGKVFVTSKFCPNCGAKMESEE